MAVFPSDSIRTKNWGTEVLTDADLEGQFDLLHTYLQSALNSTTGHAHTGAANQGPKLSPANMVIASQAAGDTLYASSATAWARLAKGTARQVLQMKSDATIPEWVSSGVTDGSLVRMTTGDKLPAVDGSLLTGVAAASMKGTVFGAMEAKSNDQVYLAATDGIVMATSNGSQPQIFSDSSNPPTTVIIGGQHGSSYYNADIATAAILKGKYWKAIGSTAILNWIPIGA